jgi:hypothetical protein
VEDLSLIVSVETGVSEIPVPMDSELQELTKFDMLDFSDIQNLILLDEELFEDG